MPPSSTASSSLCLRCLGRSLARIDFPPARIPSQRTAFSTASPRYATPPKKKGVVTKPGAPKGRTLRLAKTKRSSAATTRPPAVGERMALRKRVVLSNNNALEVPGLSDLGLNHVHRDRLQKVQGGMLGFQAQTVDALRALDVFKPTQGWNLFRRPASLIRKETVDLAADFERIVSGTKEGMVVRKILSGERGSGKSVLQLQALAMASLRGWVLVHIPEANDLTNAHTSYQPASDAAGRTYIQPHYTAKLLENIARANQSIFSQLKVRKQHELPVPVPPGSTLARLAESGARDPDSAWPVWRALWEELLSPSETGEGQKRPPVIFTLDGADHIMRLSAYLNANTKPIHAFELAIVRDFIAMLSGRTSLPNGGMILAAISESNRAAARTLDSVLTRSLAVQDGKEPPRWDPYVAHDKQVQDGLESVDVQRLQGLSKEEARGIIEYYALSGMLRNTVTEGMVGEKWTLAGGGIIGQVEKGSVGARF